VLTFWSVAPRRGSAGEGASATVVAVLAGRTENDVPEPFVLDAGLGWRAVAALRICGLRGAGRARAVRCSASSPTGEPPARSRRCDASPGRRAPQSAPSVRERFLASLRPYSCTRRRLLRALLDVVDATVQAASSRRARAGEIAIRSALPT
jgi:hypothetical protein